MAAPGLELPFWRLASKIERALEHAGNTHTVEDVWALIRHGRLQPWVSPSGRSLLLTEIVDTPSHRLLHHFLAAGDLDDIVALRADAVAWGQANGCTKEVVTGRPGWVRVASRVADGWSAPQAQISRSL